MNREFGADLTAVNVQAGAWPGEDSDVESGDVILEWPVKAGSERFSIDVRVANVERDALGFEAGEFDVALCMEVLEHLGYSPSHMFAEIHRALKPGGLLLVTVPNLINIKRTVSMVFNRTSEVPYSGYGIYGRHQREFAPSEVVRLLEACNYEVLELVTANVWPEFRGSRLTGLANMALNGLTSIPWRFAADKREYILCAARPIGEPVAAYPGWLYTHRHLYPDPPHGIRKVVLD
jgi:SAM-dependent methyltransferase